MQKYTNKKTRNARNYRTTDSVQVALGAYGVQVPKAMVNEQSRMNFLHCSLDPVTHGGRAMIPDGLGQNILPMDHRSSYDMSLPAGSVIRIIPGVPYTVLYYHPSIDATCNGLTCKAAATTFSPVQPIAGYNTAAVSALTSNYLNTTKARIVSIGGVITYTGAASAATGYITTTPASAKVDLVTPTASTQTVTFGVNGTAPSVNTLSTMVHIAKVNVPPPTINPLTPRTCRFRPENGVKFALKPLRKDRIYKQWFEYPVAIVSDMASPSTTALTSLLNQDITASPSGLVSAGYNHIDDDMEGLDIYFSAATNICLDIVVCMEYEQMQVSPYIFATVPSPPLDAEVLNSLQKVISTVPSAIPSGADAQQTIMKALQMSEPKKQSSGDSKQTVNNIANKVKTQLVKDMTGLNLKPTTKPRPKIKTKK